MQRWKLWRYSPKTGDFNAHREEIVLATNGSFIDSAVALPAIASRLGDPGNTLQKFLSETLPRLNFTIDLALSADMLAHDIVS